MGQDEGSDLEVGPGQCAGLCLSDRNLCLGIRRETAAGNRIGSCSDERLPQRGRPTGRTSRGQLSPVQPGRGLRNKIQAPHGSATVLTMGTGDPS